MSSLEQTSARIYQFPVGGRNGLARREQTAPEKVGNRAVVASSSWYHEAAMLDDQPRKPQ